MSPLYILTSNPPTGEYLKSLGSLKITCGEPYSPYNPFGRTTRKFKFNKPCMGKDRVKLIWKYKKIQESNKTIGYVRAHLIKKTLEASTQDYLCMRHGREVMPITSVKG